MNQRLHRKNHRRKKAAEEKRGMRKVTKIKKRPPMRKRKMSLDLERRKRSQRRREPGSGVEMVRPENQRRPVKLGQSRPPKGPAK